ncbi:hypothetical protein [Leptolyngbya sp. FACHB-17]|uniref:hypothetical protein n=1 Tax=Leptolyngbya sp. FACHB-17 TaxID=2692803 RepID=UPI001680BFFE|nr:hypothetical protein [Leptolyngbya sp. FACHB-17]MBD2082267.1 hypothetical protein [Leptolyngbya sp. FACHB-17]
MARPTKLTPELQERLLQAIRIGASLKTACAFVGIDYSTFRMWMQRGEGTHKTRKSDRVYVEFVEAVRHVEAVLEVEMLTAWRSHTKENWKAAAEFLARRFPERWSPSATVRLLVDREVEAELNLLFDALMNDPELSIEAKKRVFMIAADLEKQAEVGAIVN